MICHWYEVLLAEGANGQDHRHLSNGKVEKKACSSDTTKIAVSNSIILQIFIPLTTNPTISKGLTTRRAR